MSSVFSHIFRERSFKSRQNPRVDFFLGKKTLRRIQNGVFPFTVTELRVDELFTSRRRGRFTGELSVSKQETKNRSLCMTNDLRANFCRNSTFQLNRTKNAT